MPTAPAADPRMPMPRSDLRRPRPVLRSQAQIDRERMEEIAPDRGDRVVVLGHLLSEFRDPVGPLVRHQHEVAGQEVGVVGRDLRGQIKRRVQAGLGQVVVVRIGLDDPVELRVSVVVGHRCGVKNIG